jgi:hypothetical protein
VSVGLEGSDKVVVNGGSFTNTTLGAAGNTVINGAHITGADGVLTFNGTNNLAENVLITGANPDNPYNAAVVDAGTDDTLENSTIVMSPSTSPYDEDISVITSDSGFKATRDILDGPSKPLGGSYPNTGLSLSDNLYSTNKFWQVLTTEAVDSTLAEVQAAGFDTGSIIGTPIFVNAADGDYALASDSPGYSLEPIGADGEYNGAEKAALAIAVPEPGSLGILALAGLLGGRTLWRKLRTVGTSSRTK